MTRSQYSRRRKNDGIYCARNRWGLTTFANPFGYDAKSNATREYISGEWVRMADGDDGSPLDPCDIFDRCLRGTAWPSEADPSLQPHFAKMRDALIALPEDANLLCWCGPDAACHTDILIEFYNELKTAQCKSPN